MRTYSVGAVLVFAQAAWAASGLTYSTYLRAGFTPAAIATDATGNVIVAGAMNLSRIASLGPPQTAAMVVKLDPTGKQYVYLRTFGGSGSDAATGIAVDSAGDVFVVGTTSSPDFPITPGRQTGTLPGASETRAFLVEFDPQGELVFSDVLGTVSTTGLAVAIAGDRGVLVSGVANSDGLASSGDAYSVPSTKYRPYLMKLDSGGSKIVFTATGIGGNALVVDSAGDIYMAGSTVNTDYPTTPGSYQPALNPVFICDFPCQLAFPGTNQYVTKVDPNASKLIYSTGVAGNSETVNNGLAVDAAGNVYVTGVAWGSYPWTAGKPDPDLLQPLLTKLDAAGAHAIFSIPIGGAGVALGSNGDVFVGGTYSALHIGPSGIPPPLPSPPLGVTDLPTQCQVNNIATFSEGYVSWVDAATGDVLSTVLVDGSNANANGIAVAGGTNVWLAGVTSQGDTPNTPGAIIAPLIVPGPVAGAYLGEVSFSTSEAAPAQVACVMDAANGMRTTAVAPSQLLSIFGNGLGPTTGVAAKDNTTTSLAGVTVTFAGEPAPLLYVSDSQINVAVPFDIMVPPPQAGIREFAEMKVSVNEVTAPSRVLPLTVSNPSLFANLFDLSVSNCNNVIVTASSVLAINPDGTTNSCSHPAKSGTIVSLFVNGLGVDGNLVSLAVSLGGLSAEVTNVVATNPFVWRVDALVPPAGGQVGPYFQTVAMDLNFFNGVVPVGPLSVQPITPSYQPAGTPLPLGIWVTP